MVASARRPIRNDEVTVGLGSERPEVVGEPQVEANEGANPETIDRDGLGLGSGPVALVLAAEPEGMERHR